MSDVWAGMLRKYVDFLAGRGKRLLESSLADPKTLITLLRDAAGENTAKVQALLDDLAKPVVPQAATDLAKKIGDAKTKAQTALAKIQALPPVDSFTLSSAKDASTAIADIVGAVDDAISAIAAYVGGGADTPVAKAIHSITAPWANALSDMAGKLPAGFDALLQKFLKVGDASTAIRNGIKLDVDAGRLKAEFGGGDGGGDAKALVNIATPKIECFIQFKSPVSIGTAITMKVKFGMGADPMMKQIMPKGAPTADNDEFRVQLDSTNGLTFGTGADHRIVLPITFGLPGVEIREIAIARPDPKPGEDGGRIQMSAIVAAKLGSALAILSEGAGTNFTPSDSDGFTTSGKVADGLGIKLKAGPVTGGGYLKKNPNKNEYGGVFQLSFGKIGLTAIGLLDADTMALLVVIGVRFTPQLQLGFGFTLNGIGGLLASNRTIAIDPLSKMLSDGAVSNILMPDDPVASAPTILTQLAQVFPEQPGAFVVGPMVELGWGGDAGFVTGRVGVLIALPDPALVILGSMTVMVPPKAIDAPRTLELNVDLFAVLTPSEFFLKAALRNSKITGIPISGELGMLIRWAGGAEFAISAGGFFPNYKAPPKLVGLKRLAIQVSPPLKWITLSVTGYVAVTSNTVQFGGAIDLSAKVGPVKGEAHLSIDALFVFSPRFAFLVEINASVAIKAFGHSIASASFRGQMWGTAPWGLKGSASVSILWWDVDFDVGPIEWGDHDQSVLPLVDTLADVAKAMLVDSAWTTLAPALTDAVTIARAGDDLPPLLLQPFSLIQCHQTVAPFDTDIERVGAYASTAKRITLGNAAIVGAAAPCTGPVSDAFAMGQYLNLTTDQQVARPNFEQRPSGVQMSPVTGVAFGNAVAAKVTWDTFFPQSAQPKQPRMPWAIDVAANGGLLATRKAAKARQSRANPYGPVDPAPLRMADSGLKQVLPLASAGQALGAAVMTTVEAAGVQAQAAAAGQAVQQVAMGLAA